MASSHVIGPVTDHVIFGRNRQSTCFAAIKDNGLHWLCHKTRDGKVDEVKSWAAGLECFSYSTRQSLIPCLDHPIKVEIKVVVSLSGKYSRSSHINIDTPMMCIGYIFRGCETRINDAWEPSGDGGFKRIYHKLQSPN